MANFQTREAYKMSQPLRASKGQWCNQGGRGGASGHVRLVEVRKIKTI